MKFLVEIELQFPATMAAAEKAKVLEGHERRGGELIEDGTIAHIWRLTGKNANVGVWEIEDPAALSAALDSMPSFPYMQTGIRALG
ncbi:MAG TPA: muconolactone Delta-isomerase family protein [Solirubrobacterales bacterium]|nr:muconolactone Delta-isomerase family protein [Solirubrobacterales bacterium]